MRIGSVRVIHLLEESLAHSCGIDEVGLQGRLLFFLAMYRKDESLFNEADQKL